MEYLALIPEKSIVLLHTGYDQYYGQPEYYENHPVVGEDLCQMFIDKQVRLVGTDTPSLDKAAYPIHKRLLAAGICIAENLTNLEKIHVKKHFEVFALPLNIKANSSPARVIARL